MKYYIYNIFLLFDRARGNHRELAEHNMSAVWHRATQVLEISTGACHKTRTGRVNSAAKAVNDTITYSQLLGPSEGVPDTWLAVSLRKALVMLCEECPHFRSELCLAAQASGDCVHVPYSMRPSSL